MPAWQEDNHERRGGGQLKRGERETTNKRTRRLPLLKGQAGIIRSSEERDDSIWDNIWVVKRVRYCVLL